jgi:hypothetical protein
MVLNATFNNISFISWRSVLLLKETGVPGETNNLQQVSDKLYHIILYWVQITHLYHAYYNKTADSCKLSLTAECALLSVGEEHDVFGMGETKTNLLSFIFFVSSVFHSFPRYWFFTECFNMSNTTEPLVEQELPTVSEHSWLILDSFWWSSCFSSILSFLCVNKTNAFTLSCICKQIYIG